VYGLKTIEMVFTSKFVGTGPLSYKKRIYWAAVSQRLRNTALETMKARSGSRSINLLTWNLGCRWRWVVSFTPWPVYPPVVERGLPHSVGGWVGPRNGLDSVKKRKILALIVTILTVL